MAKTTFVLTVTGGPGVGADLGGVAELDWGASKNLDAEGNLKSSFLPGEEVVFVVNSPPGYRATAVLVHSRCGGGYIQPAPVNRDREESAGFDSATASATLGYWPKNSPVVNLYTVPRSTMRYDLVNRTLSPAAGEELPVEGVINYIAECQQVVYTPPAGLDLETSEDEFPVRIEIIIKKI
jgi:hypothetical protein